MRDRNRLQLVLCLILLMIIGGISACSGPEVSVSGDTGTIGHNIISTYTAKDAAYPLAADVYSAATEHPDLRQIVVNCRLVVPGGVSDKYGKSINGPLIMGSITVSDLDEVRRYKDELAYERQYVDWYKLQILLMEYSYLLAKE